MTNFVHITPTQIIARLKVVQQIDLRVSGNKVSEGNLVSGWYLSYPMVAKLNEALDGTWMARLINKSILPERVRNANVFQHVRSIPLLHDCLSDDGRYASSMYYLDPMLGSGLAFWVNTEDMYVFDYKDCVIYGPYAQRDHSDMFALLKELRQKDHYALYHSIMRIPLGKDAKQFKTVVMPKEV